MASQAGLLSAPWADLHLCSGTDVVPNFPILEIWWGKGYLLYSSISAIARLSHPCQPSTAMSTARTPWHSLPGHQHSSRGYGDKEIIFPLLGLPCCTGHMAAHGPASVAAWLPEASAVQQLDGHPAWEPAQKDGRRKVLMALVTEGRNASFCLSPRVVAAGLAVPSQLRSVC